MTHFLLAVIGYFAIGIGYTFGFLTNDDDFRAYVKNVVAEFKEKEPEVATESEDYYVNLTYICAIPFWPFFIFS